MQIGDRIYFLKKIVNGGENYDKTRFKIESDTIARITINCIYLESGNCTWGKKRFRRVYDEMRIRSWAFSKKEVIKTYMEGLKGTLSRTIDDIGKLAILEAAESGE